MPDQAVDQILSQGEDLLARHERRKLTPFFSDLLGFTEIAKAMAAVRMAIEMQAAVVGRSTPGGRPQGST